MKSHLKTRKTSRSGPSLNENRKLNQHQILALQKIGFKRTEQGKEAILPGVSQKTSKKWNKHFREFEQYKQNNRNNNTPPPSAKLCKWIVSQRKNYRKLLKHNVSKHLSWYQVDVLTRSRFPWISWENNRISS